MKTYILSILIFLFTFSLSAQKPDHDKIQSLKVSFITEQLDLTKEEAQAFWPVYNEFDKKNNKLRYHEMRSIRREIKESISTLTDAKADELLNKLNNLESSLHKNRLEFATKIRTILSPKKIIKLKIAEEDFKRKMLDQWKSRRKGGGPQGNRP
ncbi:Spy/CpxP family protein refolding chaperone [Seonamhaeicola maritimus]|uniref:Spy/CpxP family protein refolding chaperone n=1 Tax=Seonamhaeicola maritimus TaxID=2591822 RepID=UPI00249420A4|nr:sensor of ECF-type sigma factor [Seonamhaeicola maritimus]